MNTLIHLCKKDFAYAKPWLIGTWLSLLAGALLPWFSPAGDYALPFMMIGKFAPALLIFLTTAKLVQGDPLVGSNSFMATRPVTPVCLLGGKLLLIALFLILPAVLVAVLTAACMRVQLSAADYLLLLIENCLYFSLVAGAAVAYSAISRNVGIMLVYLIATPSLFLMLLAIFNLNWPFGKSLEDQHLRVSFQLVAQAFLSIAAVAIAMSWAAKRRVWLTVTGFLLCAAFLVAPGLFWKWNFVDALSKQATLEEIISDKPTLTWLDEPRLVSNRRQENILYSQLTRPGRVEGLKHGWVGKLVKFQSEARFADGTVWTSQGDSEFHLFDDFTPEILPQLGIEVPANHPMLSDQRFQTWTLFECEKRRLEKRTNHSASIRGTGIFQLDQPCIFGEMPARPGASVVNGRFRYRLDNVSAFENQISFKISIRGVALSSRGDNARGFEKVEFLFTNPKTGQFTDIRGSGGSNRVSGDWVTLHRSVSIDQPLHSTSPEETEAFLRNARLHVIGTRYGGNITLPYEIPETLLEERR